MTVIDDVEGRDMPLLRAEVGSLDMTHESGPGMARYGMILMGAGQQAIPTFSNLFCHLAFRCEITGAIYIDCLLPVNLKSCVFAFLSCLSIYLSLYANPQIRKPFPPV